MKLYEILKYYFYGRAIKTKVKRTIKTNTRGF